MPAVIFHTTFSVKRTAQKHRWHDLTPDSLRGAFFNSAALTYEGDVRVLFATYERGVLKSTDNGASWQHVLAKRNVRPLAVPVEHPNWC